MMKVPCARGSGRKPYTYQTGWVEGDALTRSKCQGPLRVFSFIEDQGTNVETLATHCIISVYANHYFGTFSAAFNG